MTSWSTVTETFGLKSSDIVFTVGSTIDINAPADIVFEIITDFPNYQSWNSWCPKFTFPDGEPVTVGSSGVMQCEMKAQSRTYDIPATILEMSSSPNEHVLAWRGGFMPQWVAVSERVQTVTPTNYGTSCRVKQWESMSGWGAYILKHLMRIEGQLAESNVTYAEDLKQHAEAKQAST